MKRSHTEFIKFIAVGVFNTMLGYLLYLLFVTFFSYQVAYSISYIIGIVISYYLNSKFVFRSPLSWKKFLQFPLVYLVQYCCGLLLLYLIINTFGVDKRIAGLLATILTVPITFLFMRLILLKRS